MESLPACNQAAELGPMVMIGFLQDYEGHVDLIEERQHSMAASPSTPILEGLPPQVR